MRCDILTFQGFNSVGARIKIMCRDSLRSVKTKLDSAAFLLQIWKVLNLYPVLEIKLNKIGNVRIT